MLYGYGGFQVGADAVLLVVDLPVARARRHLGGRQPPRRQRVRRGVAPPRDAPREAARVRRLLRGRRGAREAGVHPARQARGARRVERRAPRRSRDHPAARPLPRGPLRRPAARHGALPPLRQRQDVDSRSTARPTTPTTSRPSSRTRRTTTSTKGTKYPSTLILSADSDDRVDPMHARKFAAELQWASSGGPVLLRVEKHSGHGGADLVQRAPWRSSPTSTRSRSTR